MIFGKSNSQNDNQPMARQAKQLRGSDPAEPLLVSIEYHDGTVEPIDMTYNLEDLQHLFAQAMQNGSGISFTDFDPKITINPRYIKKVTFTRK